MEKRADGHDLLAGRTDSLALVLSGATVLGLGCLLSSEPAQAAGIVALLLGILSRAASPSRASSSSVETPGPERSEAGAESGASSSPVALGAVEQAYCPNDEDS